MPTQQSWWPPPSGPARVIVPLAASDIDQLLGQARMAATSDAELVEWRADALTPSLPAATVAVIAKGIADLVAPRPLIFTWRTADEGGKSENDSAYLDVTQTVITAGAAGLVDVQVGHPAAADVISLARQASVPVIGSWHSFDEMPSRQAIVASLAQAEQAGASVAKVAVMPTRPEDVVTLMAATADRADVSGVPLITVAMGELGVVSRVFGHVFGSQATFASLGVPSAPGQLALDDLRAYWAALPGSSAQASQ